MSQKWVEVLRAIAHPWLCDAQGHLNTRHYAAMFDEAGWLTFSLIGYKASAASEQNFGWADVRHVTEYKKEVPAGAFVRLDASIIKLGKSSVTIAQRMVDLDDEAVVATFEAVSVAYDLKAHRSREIPPEMRAEAQRVFGI